VFHVCAKCVARPDKSDNFLCVHTVSMPQIRIADHTKSSFISTYNHAIDPHRAAMLREVKNKHEHAPPCMCACIYHACMHLHTCMGTHMHTYIHSTCMHAYLHTYRPLYTRTHLHAYTTAYTYTYTHTQTHTYTHSLTYTHMHSFMHT
jgi:hypothetical protein